MASWATGITADGAIVGTSQTAGRKNVATRWNTDGTVTALPTLAGGNNSGALAVNTSGTAVGFANSANTPSRPVLWDKDGHVTDLGILPGGYDASADAISPNGRVAGSATVPTDSLLRPVRWSQG